MTNSEHSEESWPAEPTEPGPLDFTSGFAAQESFGTVPWQVISGLRGNAHSSLIGLISQWWINSGDSNWVLDGPPKCKDRYADLILGSDHTPNAVVEIEGTEYLRKLDSIARYLEPGAVELSTISTGILVAYAYPPDQHEVPFDRIIRRASEITLELNNKWIIIIELSKTKDHLDVPLMSRTEFYNYRFDKVRMLSVRGGSAFHEPATLFDPQRK
jgi:hypothetical protein